MVQKLQNKEKTSILRIYTFVGDFHIFCMYTGKTQIASWVWIVPDGPYLKKEHFVTRGNIIAIGSILFSGSASKKPNADTP